MQPFPDLRGGRWHVSSADGSEPMWSRDGRELCYRNGTGEMVGAKVVPTGAPPIGEQRVLVSAAAFGADPRHTTYDGTPDGRRFVMTREKQDGAGAETQLIVVENFFEALQRMVPRSRSRLQPALRDWNGRSVDPAVRTRFISRLWPGL